MKATEQYIPLVLFIMLYKVVLSFEIQMYTCEYCSVLLELGVLFEF